MASTDSNRNCHASGSPIRWLNPGQAEIFGVTLKGVHPPQDFILSPLEHDGWQVIWHSRTDMSPISIMLAERTPGEYRDSGPVYSVEAKEATNSPALLAELQPHDVQVICRLGALSPPKPDYTKMVSAGFDLA